MKPVHCLLLLLVLLPLQTYPQNQDALSGNQTQSVSERFDPVAATNTYINTLTSGEKKISDQYYEGGYWLILWGLLVEILLALIFLSSGLSGWMKKLSKAAKNIHLQNLIYIALYIILSFLLTLPYSIYVDFIREHHYDLLNLSFGAWLGEEMINLGISLVMMSLLIVLIYMVIRKVMDHWWIWAAAIGTAFFAFSLFIYPVFFDPLFNDYKELPDGALKEEILSLARSNGVPADDVYQFNASRQTKRISANVSGMGKTIRISLNDNLLNRCSPEEIKSVMAHEMGHYVLNHIPKFILTFGLLLFLGFWISNLSFKWILAKFGKKWDIDGIKDIGGLPLLAIILIFYVTLATPVTNTIIRQSEVECDIFGLNAAREPDGFAGVAMKTSEYRKVDPGHWEEIIFFDHPSPRSRVFMAMRWKAEQVRNSDKDK